MRSLAAQQVEAIRGRLVAIYRDAFSLPPYAKGEDEVAGFARFLPEHVTSSLSERADFSVGGIDDKLIPCLSHSSEPPAGSMANDSQVQHD